MRTHLIEFRESCDENEKLNVLEAGDPVDITIKSVRDRDGERSARAGKESSSHHFLLSLL